MNKVLNAEQLQQFQLVIQEYKDKKGPLMQLLQESQSMFGCVPIEIQQMISEEMNISTAKINGVVSFYSMFSLEPGGKHRVGVCTGTACYVKGASRNLDRVKEYLEIDYHETTKDGLFTLEPTRCVGDCSKASVIMIDDTIYGNVTSDDIVGIFEIYKKGAL